MLAVSPLRNAENKNGREGEVEGFSMGGDEFPDFSGGNLLDSIDFDDLFLGISDGDVLPDLEMDPEILAEFSASGGEESEINTSVTSVERVEDNLRKDPGDDKVSASSGFGSNQEEEIVSKREEHVLATNNSPYPKETTDKTRSKSSSAQSNKNAQGKRKAKVDWTPELHRRFVQAVEQLGVDKAVPSRILELMGIDCLTRHNIASHLQKYRSHRKHMLAREAEAASWSQRRQMYGTTGGGGSKNMNPWLAPLPTMGFPPISPSPLQPHFRPLHVWGHPSFDQSLMHINPWPKHLVPSPSPPPPPPIAAPWAPSPHPPTARPPPDPSFWHSHHQKVPNSLTPGTPCFPPPPLATTRFATPPVPGIPPHAVYRVDQGIGVPAPRQSTGPHPHHHPPYPPFDFHPSKESIDAAIGDVLAKPFLPLPIGLKPPSIDSVMVELQRQGIPKIPPTCV
ncbi:hypothetical protein NMG60_11032835 [Bertholletia excelsa]